jgi:hypothetical protein
MSAGLLASVADQPGCSKPDRVYDTASRFGTIEADDAGARRSVDSRATRLDVTSGDAGPKPKSPALAVKTGDEETPSDDSALPKLEHVFAHPLARTLASAAERADNETLKRLLAEGADADEQGVEGASVLMWAIINNSLDGARALLDAGADPNLADDLGNSPLLLAATREDSRFVEVLVARGANANAENVRGTTPLIVASALGRTEAVRLLITAKADVNAIDGSGRGALHYAALDPKAHVLRLLIEAGAKADLEDNAGLTPADLAPIGSSDDVTELLMQR